jgi:hypothetical protein
VQQPLLKQPKVQLTQSRSNFFTFLNKPLRTNVPVAFFMKERIGYY